MGGLGGLRPHFAFRAPWEETDRARALELAGNLVYSPRRNPIDFGAYNPKGGAWGALDHILLFML